MVHFMRPDIEFARWLVWMIFIVHTAFVCAFPLLFPRAIPKFEIGFLWLSMALYVGTLVPLFAMNWPKQTAEAVFANYENFSGWPSGMSYMMAVGSGMYTFIATDSVTHLAEVVLFTLKLSGNAQSGEDCAESHDGYHGYWLSNNHSICTYYGILHK